MRLIDAYAAIEAMSNVTVLDKSAARRILTQLPTIEAAPVKHGRWVNEGIYGEGHSQCSIRCSNCDWHYIGYPGDYKYCPECGSKNDEV